MKILKELIKNQLRKRGLKIATINATTEKVELVRFDWLKKMDICTIVDVGASTGGFASRARQLFPNAMIYAFEPLEDAYGQLVNYFENDSQFIAHQMVMAAEKGEVSFYQNDYSGSSSMLEMAEAHIKAYPFTKNAQQITVTADTLDNFFSDKDLKGEIMLKMDVQGAEHLVIQGAKNLLKRVNVIFTEVSFVTLYENTKLFNEIVSLLENEGFIVRGMENISQSTIDGSYLQADVYFTRKG